MTPDLGAESALESIVRVVGLGGEHYGCYTNGAGDTCGARGALESATLYPYKTSR
jgi:hypothetical protein